MPRHVYYDLIMKWVENPAQPIQFWDQQGNDWIDCVKTNGIYSPMWSSSEVYRIKPREFKEGWWYPVKDKLYGVEKILRYDAAASVFRTSAKDRVFYQEIDLEFIGEGFQPDFGENK